MKEKNKFMKQLYQDQEVESVESRIDWDQNQGTESVRSRYGI